MSQQDVSEVSNALLKIKLMTFLRQIHQTEALQYGANRLHHVV